MIKLFLKIIDAKRNNLVPVVVLGSTVKTIIIIIIIRPNVLNNSSTCTKNVQTC